MNLSRKGDILSSFNSAYRGLIEILKIERNFRLHLAIGAVVIISSLFLNLPLAEFLVILLVTTLVMVAEVFNTVCEMFTDVIFREFSVEARRIKDVSAAAVLLTALTAIITGYLVVAKHFPSSWRSVFENIAASPWYVTFVVLVIVTFLAILLKLVIKKDSFLSGGMPSLHSGVSFSIWTIVSFLTFHQQPLISFLVLLLSIWVAQSRIQRGIHSLEEVVIGALLGILITIMVIQIFWGFFPWKI